MPDVPPSLLINEQRAEDLLQQVARDMKSPPPLQRHKSVYLPTYGGSDVKIVTRNKVRTRCSTVKDDLIRMRSLMLLGIIDAVQQQTLQLLLVPFARTLQHCDLQPTTAAAADVTSPEWSGSLHCADRALVAAGATRDVNYANSLFLLIQFFLLPSFGSLADTVGRNTIMAWYFFGVGAFCFANMAFPAAQTLIISRALQGCFGEVVPIMHTQVVDYSSEEERSTFFVVYLMTKMTVSSIWSIGFNATAISWHMYDYTNVLLGLAALNFCGVLISLISKETLRERKPLDCAALDPFKALQVLRHKWINMVSFSFALVSAFSISVLPGYLLIAYHWGQEANGYLALLLLPAVVTGGVLNDKCGLSWRYALVAIILMNVMFAVSAVHPVILLGGFFIGLTTIGVMPSLFTTLTKITSKAEQGKLMGSFAAINHLAAGVGLIVYGKLAELMPLSETMLVLPFIVGATFGLLSAFTAVVANRVASEPYTQMLDSDAAGPPAADDSMYEPNYSAANK